MSESVERLCISIPDQHSFAQISKDFNPLHTDPTSARRSLYGCTILHGVQALLGALTVVLETSDCRIQRLCVDFRMAMFPKADYAIDIENALTKTVITVSDSQVRLRAEIWTDKQVSSPSLPEPVEFPGAAPAEPELEELEGLSGEVPLSIFDRAGFYCLFTRAKAEHWPVYAHLLAASYLVGMRCPGKRSLLTNIALDFGQDQAMLGSIKYRVSRCQERFKRIEIDVANAWCSGRIVALMTPPRSEQISYTRIHSLGSGHLLKGQRVAVVGGSRGIGEVSAKICASWGAKILLTYLTGASDAKAVAAEIGTGCQVTRWNAFEENDEEILAFKPDHLLYFATPAIRKRGRFSDEILGYSQQAFERLHHTYTVRFLRLLANLQKPGVSFGAFWPSSTATEGPVPSDLLEYAAAKAAGERVLNQLPDTWNSRVSIHRFPLMRTDQALFLIPQPAMEPYPLVFKALEEYFTEEKCT